SEDRTLPAGAGTNPAERRILPGNLVESADVQPIRDMSNLVAILFLILFIYLLLLCLYLFFLAVAGHLRKSRYPAHHPEKKKIAVLMTSVGDSRVIYSSAAAACRHDYPADRF